MLEYPRLFFGLLIINLVWKHEERTELLTNVIQILFAIILYSAYK